LEEHTFQEVAEVNYEAWVVHTGTAESSMSALKAELQGQLSGPSNAFCMKNKPKLELTPKTQF